MESFMIKNLLKAVVTLLLFSTLPALAQTYTHGHLTATTLATPSHDSNSCQSTCMLGYIVTKDSSFVNDSIKVYDTLSGLITCYSVNTTGVIPWTTSVFPFMSLFTPVIADDQLSGSFAVFLERPLKIFSGLDTLGAIHDVFPLIVSNPCIYDTISGRVYIDNNANCTYDGGDTALNGMQINSINYLSSPTLSYNYRSLYTNPVGYYNMRIQKSWMVNYTVALPSQYYFIYPLSTCFTGAYSYTTLPHANVDFPLRCSDSVDVMSYSMYPPAIKIGRVFYMEPYVSNTGCNPASGVLTFVKDHKVIYDPALSMLPATYVSGDTLQWNYTNLTNLGLGTGYWNSMLSMIHLFPDTSAHAGDTLCFHIYSDIPATDIDHSNNDQTICLPVVNAYDPNVKEVSPKGTGILGLIPASTPKLSYIVNFQNTGTAAAQNVQVVDTLDVNLDPASLKIQGSSAMMTPEWLAPNVVRFNFNNIFLPDSSADEAASHGSVSFSIKLHPSLPAGTQIRNKGYIYFDSNPAVITNTALNTISSSLQTQPIVAALPLRIYPNPVHDILTIESPEAATVVVTNMSGEVVASKNITAGKAMLDLSKCANGLYIIKTVSSDKVTTSKLIKQ
jgi:hypothetical protein